MFKRSNVHLNTGYNMTGYNVMLCKNKWDNDYLVAQSTYQKEYKKKVRQARGLVGGLFLSANKADWRQVFFLQSAPATSRLILKRSWSVRQDAHWTSLENRWQVMRKNNEVTHLDTRMMGGMLFTRNWDSSIGFTDDLSLHMLKRGDGPMTKDRGIQRCEEWGLKHTVIDSELNAGPRMVDFRKRHHPLYADNFPYLGENKPISNRYHGDADFIWRGNDKFDYSVYGAKTVSPYNYFRPSVFETIRNIPFYNTQFANAGAAAAAPTPASKPATPQAEAPQQEKKKKAAKPAKEE